tara:strand:- start:8381 stop:9286 length:906 start_codon:yes stop_codon:yes gene_type:complete
LANKEKKGQQVPAIPKKPKDLFQITLDLGKDDDLITGRGVEFEHWIAIPSPIGLKDRGDYRRSDQYDSISSNGMIYKKAGCFTAALVSNQKRKTPSQGGIFDYSTARMLVPRFYNDKEVADGEEIHLAPGDRVFVKDIEVLVSTYHRMQYNAGGLDRAQFPVKSVQHIIDSTNKEYKCGYHFKIQDGHIKWIAGRSNPGIDPETGRGRIYAMRYKYNAHWYITEIPNEVRVIQGTDDSGKRCPQRMSYQAIVQREYVYYNQNNDVDKDHGRETEVRDIEEPKEAVEVIGDYQIKVDMDDIE